MSSCGACRVWRALGEDASVSQLHAPLPLANPVPREVRLRCARGTRPLGIQRSSHISCSMRMNGSTSWNSTGRRWWCLDLPSGGAFRPRARCPVLRVGSLVVLVSFEERPLSPAQLTQKGMIIVLGNRNFLSARHQEVQQKFPAVSLGTFFSEPFFCTFFFRFCCGTSKDRDAYSQALVHRGPTEGWLGFVQGVVEGTTWNAPGSGNQSAFIVNRALGPLLDRATTDLEFASH